MKIKNIEIKNGLVLAPMAGFSEFAFRSLCREFGAELSCTEMLSAKGICYKSKSTEEMTICLENETPKVAQIFGSDPKYMAMAVKSEYLKKFDIIDINMGCPAPKIYKNFEGSNLMSNMQLAESIIKACVEATDKPITVKFRKGIDDEHINAVEFAKMCEKAGASAITIHGRTRKQYYAGNVDYNIIKEVVDAVKIPVFGNGDVVDKQSYEKMKATGCAGVMIGRGAIGKPWIFAELLGQKIDIKKIDIVKKHINLLCENMEERKAIIHFRKHLARYLKGEKFSTEQKLKVLLIENKIDLIEELEKIFK